MEKDQLSMEDLKARMETMKLWFETNFILDKRADCLGDVQAILNMSDRLFMSLNVTELNRMMWKLSQYRTTLGELTSEIIRTYNFASIYRKFQTAATWNKMKAELEAQAKKITNKELDEKTEQLMWQQRCVEVFMQERADTYKNVLDAIDTCIFNARSRIKELENQRFEKTTDNYYGGQTRTAHQGTPEENGAGAKSV